MRGASFALIAIGFFLQISRASAEETWDFEELGSHYTSIRKMAMGGAYVALADDHSTVFLNPAGLANLPNPRVHLLPLLLEVSDDPAKIYSSDDRSSVSNVSLDSLSVLAGKNIYGRSQVAPLFTIPYFGFGFLIDEQIALYNKNKALPLTYLGIQSTRVLQASFAYSFGRGRLSRNRPDLKVGLGVKIAWRRGGLRKLTQTEVLSLVSGATLTAGELVGSMKEGYGFDVGGLYTIPIHKGLQFNIGAAYINVGDVSFGSGDDMPASMEDNAAIGVAAKYDTGFMNLNVSYEYSDVFESYDWRKKNHFGIEIGLPLITLYGGINQIYFTYGAEVNLLIFKFKAARYTQELSSFVGMEPNTRYQFFTDISFEL